MSISSHISLNRNWFQYYECWQKKECTGQVNPERQTHSHNTLYHQCDSYSTWAQQKLYTQVEKTDKHVRTVCNTGDRVFNNLYNPWTRWYTFIGLVFSFKYVECCESHHLYECLTTESCDLVSVAYHGWRTVHSARLNNKFTLLGL